MKNSKWFCRLCWRHGDLFVAMPEAEAIEHAKRDHAHAVDVDMRAEKVPAGMEDYRNAAFMDKYKAVNCAGEIELGAPDQARVRFDRKLMPVFDFDHPNTER